MYAQLIPAPAVTIDPDVVAEVREAARVLAIPLLKGERYTRNPKPSSINPDPYRVYGIADRVSPEIQMCTGNGLYNRCVRV